MNLKNWARRALVVVAVTTTLAAAGQAHADSGVPTPSPSSGTVLATAALATAPRSPTAKPGNTAVKLAWLAPASNGGAKINSYRVQRATSAKGPWKSIAKPTVRRYRAVGLKNGTRYYFRVAAHNVAGWSTPSKVVSAVPRTVPTAPQSPTATPGNATVKLAWLAPSSNGGATIGKYRVQQASSASGPWTTIATPTVRSSTAGGLANGIRYYFHITAHNAAGWSTPSKVVSAVPRTVPTAPQAPTATPGNGTVELKWLAPSSSGGATTDKYAVQQWTNSVGPQIIADPTELSHAATGLTNGTTYYFAVRAHNAAGWSEWSTVVSAVPHTVPSAPLGLWANYNAPSGTTNVYWSPPASDGGAAIDNYHLVGGKGYPTWGLVTTSTSTPVVLGPGTWTLKVRAHNAAGYGEWSNDYIITIP
jgi:fibronectin type 3 domain-containing protein